MNIFRFLNFSILISSSALAFAQNGYLCTGSQSTGFINKTGRWQKTHFDTSSYVVSRATEEDASFAKKMGQQPSEWVMKYSDMDFPVAACERVRIGLNCGQGDLVINTETMDFISISKTYYLNPLPKNAPPEIHRTASMEIGKCVTF